MKRWAIFIKMAKTIKYTVHYNFYCNMNINSGIQSAIDIVIIKVVQFTWIALGFYIRLHFAEIYFFDCIGRTQNSIYNILRFKRRSKPLIKRYIINLDTSDERMIITDYNENNLQQKMEQL